MADPIFKNDAIVLGILMGILSIVFITNSSRHRFWKKFYKYVPAPLLCYFIPSIFNSLGIISGEKSNLYFIASRYLLPASLALLTITVDIPGIKKLGPKALILFFTGTISIIIGGPIAIIAISIWGFLNIKWYLVILSWFVCGAICRFIVEKKFNFPLDLITLFYSDIFTTLCAISLWVSYFFLF